MLRKLVLLLMLLLVFGLGATALAQTPEGETYTSEDGRISITYPAGWWVSESFDTISLGNSEEPRETFDLETRLNPGEAAIGISMLETSGLDTLLPGDTVLEKMQALIDLFEGEPGGNANLFGTPLSEPVEITVGDYPAARTTTTEKAGSNNVVLLLMELADDYYVLAAGLTAPGEMARFEPKLLSIIATLRFNPAPQGGEGVSAAELQIMTTDNAGQTERLSSLRGHTGTVYTLDFSPDSATLASAGDDLAIRLWDIAAGSERLQLTGHRATVRLLDYSQQGSRLLSISDDGTVRVWDTETGDEVASSNENMLLWYAAYSPAGDWIAYVSYDRNTTTGQTNESNVWLWNPDSNEKVAVESFTDGEFVNSLAFNADGTSLAYSASVDNGEAVAVWVYDVAGEETRRLGEREGNAIDVFFNADGRATVTYNDLEFNVMVYDLERERELFTLPGHRNYTYQTLLSSDRLILGTANYEGTTRLWDMTSGDELAVLTEQSATATYGLAFSPDGKLVATSNTNGRVTLWGVRD